MSTPKIYDSCEIALSSQDKSGISLNEKELENKCITSKCQYAGDSYHYHACLKNPQETTTIVFSEIKGKTTIPKITQS